MNTSQPTSIAKTLFDADIRVEQIIHIASMCLHENWPDNVNDAVIDNFESVFPLLGLEAPEEFDAPHVWEMLYRKQKLGFLVQVATPVPVDFNDDGGYSSYSWGYYGTGWLYGESMDEIYGQMLKWKEDYIEKKRQQAMNDAA